jgi:hypothetical protein
MLALIQSWHGQLHDDPIDDDWRLSPRQITAIAGQFDPPRQSSNDPHAALAQYAPALVLLCAINRANALISASVSRKFTTCPEIAEIRVIAGFLGFFALLYAVTNELPPHTGGIP